MPYHEPPPNEYPDTLAERLPTAATPPPAEGDPPLSTEFSWAALLPYLVMMLQDENPAMQESGLRDLRQMARAADKYNAMIRVAAAE